MVYTWNLIYSLSIADENFIIARVFRMICELQDDVNSVSLI